MEEKFTTWVPVLVSAPDSRGTALKEFPSAENETYLILLEESLHIFVRFCVFVLDNELTPSMANLKEGEKTQ